MPVAYGLGRRFRHFPFKPYSPLLRSQLEEKLSEEGSLSLWKEIEKSDPAAAKSIDPRNERRVIRALEAIKSCGSFTSCLPTYSYLFPCLQIGLDLSRGELDKRIENRVEKMRETGLEEEVKGLKGKMSKTASQAIGYGQILSYFRGEIGREEAYEQ
ncbi:MAG: hypothetical protein IIV98_01125, partial [Aeriscardovia sp.]|nr:hypothetical protein [Aeriscardovia sp.]